MDNFNIHKFLKSEYIHEDKMSSDREIEIIKKMNPDADEKSLKKIAKLGKDKVKEIVKKVVAQKQMDKPSTLDSYMEFDPLMNEGVEKEMFIYLDELRDSGVTNMFGAAPYLQREGLTYSDVNGANLRFLVKKVESHYFEEQVKNN